MRPFKPEPFVMQIGRLEHNLGLFKKEGKLTEYRRGEFLRHFERLARKEKKYGLKVSASNTDLAVTALKEGSDAEIEKRIDEMVRIARRTLHQEMEQFVYFEIPAKQRQFWEDTMPFGQTVATKLPQVAYDLEESSNA